MRGSAWKRGAVGCAVLLAASSAGGVPCTIDVAPAATLLVPSFSLDTSKCGSSQETTVATILNVRADPVLTHVTVWSNLGVPVLGFDLYLQGYDEQRLNLTTLVCQGLVPVSGETTSPLGSYSKPPVHFTACTDPVAQPLSAAALADLQASLNGAPAPSTDMCSGLPTGRAEGYVTVDVTQQCTALDPGQAGYYAGIIGFDNALAGEIQIGRRNPDLAQGFEAVHIEAYPAIFAPGDVTFYGRYVSASAADAREPLGTAYRTPYDLTAATSSTTELLVWREVGSAAAPFACGTTPAWFPLPVPTVVAFADQDVAGLGGLPMHAALARATQRIGVGAPGLRLHPASAAKGWVFLNLQHAVGPYSPSLRVGQAWVSGVRTRSDELSTGQHATQLDSACAPASIPFTAPGRADSGTIPSPP